MKNKSSNVMELLAAAIDAKNKGDFPTARKQLRTVLSEARQIRNAQAEANALLELSAIVIQQDRDLATGRKLLEDCLRIYSNMRFDRGKAYAMSNLGSLALDEADYDDALQWFNKALTIFEQEQDKYGVAMTLHQIGMADSQRKDFASAEKHWRQSLLIFEGLGRKFAAGQVLLSLGKISLEYHNDLQQAKLLFSRALTFFEELGNQHEANKARHNLAIVEGSESGRAASH